MRYAILLRGINVGGHNKIPMADLRKVLVTAGFENPQTYIQSGNVVVDSDKKIATKKISELIKTSFDLTIPVVIQTKQQVLSAIKNNPFSNTVFEPKRLHVLFLNKKIDSERSSQIDASKYSPDVFKIIDNHIFVLYNENSWASKLTINVFEKEFGVTATARNWNTALKLADMIES